MVRASYIFSLVAVAASLSHILPCQAIAANYTAASVMDSETFALLSLSLQDVMNVKVTSVSKKEEKLFQASAAIFVITAEDIARSGAQTIPDALRLAPGIQVAQAGASRWSVSARGFNDQFANKLLVLMDGRTIYTPMFSGVYWDQQDTVLEDIDRIEIIRGPGATLWGVNAVNGVINIITKHAADTQGSLLSAATGTTERINASARYGGKLADGNLAYRSYGKYFDRAGLESFQGGKADDSWHNARGGFRIDKKLDSENNLTVQGDAYNGRENVQLSLPTTTAPFVRLLTDNEEIGGGNILMRLEHDSGQNSQSTLQAYYDVVMRDGTPTASQDVRTFDLDFQHISSPFARHEITWGGGYRNIDSNFEGTPFFYFSPDKRTQHFFNSFIQDKIDIIPDKWNIALGTKLEHNPFTGFEYQPSLRSSYLISPSQTLWGAVSRAVRIPNRAINDITFIQGTPRGTLTLLGNKDAVSEKMIAYEAGYRTQLGKNLFSDITLFYNDYSKLSSNQFLSRSEARSANEGSGNSYGMELASRYSVRKNWQLNATASLLEVSLSNGLETNVNSIRRTPRAEYGLQSSLELSPGLQLNNQLYYVSRLKDANIEGYVRFDTNLAWKLSPHTELSLIGQNLFDSYHPEFKPNLNETQEEVGRSIIIKAVRRF